MKNIPLTVLCVLFLCVGCATPDKLRKSDMRGISSLSIVISATIAVDVSGFTDSVDLPLSKTISKKFLALAKTTLQEKQFQVVDQHISIGNAYSRKKFYVVTSEGDRKRAVNELERKPGPYYSDGLTKEQLAMLYKDFGDHDDIPTLGTMGFPSDATLVMQVRGRLIGTGKALGASIANIAIMTMYIAGGGGSFGGTPGLEDTDDTYQVQMRLYSTKSGDILWQSDINKTNSVDKILQEMKMILQERIPARV